MKQLITGQLENTTQFTQERMRSFRTTFSLFLGSTVDLPSWLRRSRWTPTLRCLFYTWSPCRKRKARKQTPASALSLESLARYWDCLSLFSSSPLTSPFVRVFSRRHLLGFSFACFFYINVKTWWCVISFYKNDYEMFMRRIYRFRFQKERA